MSAVVVNESSITLREMDNSEVTEHAHEEELDDSPPAPTTPTQPAAASHPFPFIAAAPLPPPSSSSFPPPHTAFAVTSTPPPAPPPRPFTYGGLSATPTTARQQTPSGAHAHEPVPHPRFFPFGTFPLPSPINRSTPSPCPVQFTPVREREAQQASERRQQLLDEKLHHAELRQTGQRRSLGCLTALLVLLLMLAVVAFIAGALYLADGSDSTVGSGGVDSSDIAAAAVTAPKLACQAVDSGALDASLLSTLLALNLTYEEALAQVPTAGRGLSPSPVNPHVLNVNVDGSALVITAGSLTVATAAITAARIAPAAVTAQQLQNGSVTAAALSDAAVDFDELGDDVLQLLNSTNTIAAAALAARPQSGAGVNVTDSVISLQLDSALFHVTANGTLTIADASISGSLFAPAGVNASSMAPAVFALFPTAGAGLVFVSSSNSSSAFAAVTDNSSVVISSASALTVGLVSAINLAPASVLPSHLSPALNELLDAVAARAQQAQSLSQQVTQLDAAMQSQLLSALGLEDQSIASLARLTAGQLQSTIAAVNATAHAVLQQVDSAKDDWAADLTAQAAEVMAEANSSLSTLPAHFPTAGAGLTLVHGSSGTASSYSLLTDGQYLGVVDGSLTVTPASIDSSRLAAGCVTNSRLAADAVSASALADSSVGLQHLSPPLSEVLSLLAVDAADVLTVGSAANDSDVLITTAGGDLLLRGGGGGVRLASAGAAMVELSGSGGMTASAANIGISALTATLDIQGESLAASGQQVSLSSGSSALSLSAAGASLSSTVTSLTAASTLTLQSSSSTVFQSSQLTLSPASLQLTTLDLNVDNFSQLLYTLDLAQLAAASLRLVGMPAVAPDSFFPVNLSGCDATTAGVTVTVSNALAGNVSVLLPPASCSRDAVLLLPPLAAVTITCLGLVNAQPQLDCSSVGAPLPTSAQTISEDTASGEAETVTSVGTVLLNFTPSAQTDPVTVSFVISSAQFTANGGGSAGVLLSAINSGSTDSRYSSSLQTPVWLCGSQVLNAAAGALTVTMVNVGDPLYPAIAQQLQFLYAIQ